jgi:hypothetical protein
VTFNAERGYIGTAPELRSPVVALSLGGLRRKVEAVMMPEGVIVVLNLDKGARLERDQPRRGGPARMVMPGRAEFTRLVGAGDFSPARRQKSDNRVEPRFRRGIGPPISLSRPSAQYKRSGIGCRVGHQFGISSERGDALAQRPFLISPGLTRKHWKDPLMCLCIDFWVQLFGV